MPREILTYKENEWNFSYWYICSSNVINTSHVFAAEVDLKYEVIFRDTSARLASITIELISPSASCGRKLVGLTGFALATAWTTT